VAEQRRLCRPQACARWASSRSATWRAPSASPRRARQARAGLPLPAVNWRHARSSQRGPRTLCMQSAPVCVLRLCARHTCFVIIRPSQYKYRARCSLHVPASARRQALESGKKKFLCPFLLNHNRMVDTGWIREAHARVGRPARCAGLTLTEAQNINRSLLELGNVISALMQNASHVPYRRAPAPAPSTHAAGRIAPRTRACCSAAGRACWPIPCAHVLVGPPAARTRAFGAPLRWAPMSAGCLRAGGPARAGSPGS